MKNTAFLGALLFALPATVYAATPLSSVYNIIQEAGVIIGMLVPIMVAAAMVVFFYGLILYIRSPGKNHDKGKQIMIAGLGSLFVMASLWGIIAFVQDALTINRGAGAQSPAVPIPGVPGGSVPLSSPSYDPNAPMYPGGSRIPS